MLEYACSRAYVPLGLLVIGIIEASSVAQGQPRPCAMVFDLPPLPSWIQEIMTHQSLRERVNM